MKQMADILDGINKVKNGEWDNFATANGKMSLNVYKLSDGTLRIDIKYPEDFAPLTTAPLKE